MATREVESSETEVSVVASNFNTPGAPVLTERNRQFIVVALTLTLCIEFLLSTVAVLFLGVRTEIALAITAPLAAFVAIPVAFYFPRR
jgi:hypothetical protein